jgi:nucleotide-binding universal stress UspA family protein
MTIVVGYVPTPEGLAALNYAVETAAITNGPLVVVNSGIHGDDAVAWFASQPELDAVADRLSARGIHHEVRQPAQAESPADEILAAAAEHGADLIVIGVRRRSPVGKLILGSTSQRVILEADCPVVSVKRPD